MDINDILLGESQNLEYKRERPSDSKKYLKTVVAFANGTGGKLIIGVSDTSHEIVGVEKHWDQNRK